MTFHLHIDLHKKLPELNMTLINEKDKNNEDFTTDTHKNSTFFKYSKCTICQDRSAMFQFYRI